MSKNKPDLVLTGFYEPMLNKGAGFANSPRNNEQALTERMYSRVLTEACINRFTWVGMPDSVDTRFLELELHRSALVVFYFDHSFDQYLALKAGGVGALNHQDNPTKYRVWGGQHLQKTLKGADVVPIYANTLRYPTQDIVQLYSKKLAHIDRTIEINVQKMRYSTIIAAPEHQKLSWTNIVRQMDEGQPYIMASNALDPTAMQGIDLSVHPESLPNLLIAKSKMWNECMTLLGINNSNQDKRERLVADEVHANDSQIQATRDIHMNSRLQACDLINKKFKLSVDCIFQDKPSIPEMPMPQGPMG